MFTTPTKTPSIYPDPFLPLSPLNPNDLYTFLSTDVSFGTTQQNLLKTRSGKTYVFNRSVPKDLMALYNNPKKILKICRERDALKEENAEMKKLHTEYQDEIDDLKEDNTALYYNAEELIAELDAREREIAKLKKMLEETQQHAAQQQFASPSRAPSTPSRRLTLTPRKRLSTSTRRKSICLVKDQGFIRVYARVRPFVETDGGSHIHSFVNHLKYSPDGKHILVYKAHDLSNSSITKEYKFELDRVFRPDHTNEDVFSMSSLKDDIRTVTNGGRVSIFAYGHTGSGKTYTMVGDMGKKKGAETVNTTPVHGLLQKSLLHLFFNPNLSVHLSVIEVYGEYAYDLIDARSQMNKKSVEAAEKVPVKNMDQVLQCIEFALENRTIAETQGNSCSSRSHCIFRITVEGQKNGRPFEGVFNVVDLAGSEKIDETLAVSSQIRQETKAINKSLCLLSSVIKAKIQGLNHVPYRDTLLTALLKKDLSSQESKMNLIINVSPRPELCDKTLNSLTFVRSAVVSEMDGAAMVDDC